MFKYYTYLKYIHLTFYSALTVCHHATYGWLYTSSFNPL